MGSGEHNINLPNKLPRPPTYPEIPVSIAPPQTVSYRLSFADVAMRFVQDLPLFAIIAVVGLLAMKGTADSRDFIITGLGSLLAKSWPKAINVAGHQANAILPYIVALGGLAKCLIYLAAT